MFNSKTIYWAVGGTLVGLLAVFAFSALKLKPVDAPVSQTTHEDQVRAVVADFGSRLKNVSLLAPTVAADIEKEYGDLISADLLAAWQKEPIKTPGRLTSSPAPERIEILEVVLTDDGAYEVQGRVIEGINSYSIAMKLRNREGKWIITGFVKAL